MRNMSDFGSEINSLGTSPLSQNVADLTIEVPEFDPSEPPEPLDDPVLVFLGSVLPSTGPYAVRGLKTLIKKDDPSIKAKGAIPSTPFCNVYVGTIAELAARARRLSDRGIEAYYTVASFRQATGPKAGSNIRELRAFRLDVEGSPDKAKSGEGYASPQEAKSAVLSFCKAARLPAPQFVFSGHGVHAYWPLRAPIPLREWTPYAQGLKRACEAHNLLADPAITADAARILRVPGTKNFKYMEAAAIELDIESRGNGPYEIGAFLPLLDYEQPPSEDDGQPATHLWSPGNEAYLRTQLFKLSSDVPYPEWFKIACGVHSLGWGETGFTMFDDWSKTAAHRYSPDAARALWENLNERARHPPEKPPITWGTIDMLAEQAGWTASEGIAARETAEQAEKGQAAREAVARLKKSTGLDMSDIEAALPSFTPFPEFTQTTELRPHIITKSFCWRDLSTVAPRPVLGADGHYCRGYLSATIGQSGRGKTSHNLAEAVGFAAGVNLFDNCTPFRHGPLNVWYWNLEDPYDEIERRALAIMSHYKLRDQDIGDRLALNSGRDQALAIAEPDGKGRIKFVETLIKEIIEVGRRIKTDVLIVDPFVSSHRLSENDNMAIDAVSKRWAKIGGALNCAVEIAHHIRKPAAGNLASATDDDARGGSSFKAATRATRIVNGMTATEARAFQIPEDDTGRYYRVDRGTTNMQEATKRSKWFKFASVDFHNGTAEYRSDNVGVSTAWTPPNAFERLNLEEQSAIIDAVRDGKGELRLDGRAANWVGKTVAEAMEWDPKDEDVKQAVKAIIQGAVDKGYLTVREGKDSKRRVRSFIVATDKEPAV